MKNNRIVLAVSIIALFAVLTPARALVIGIGATTPTIDGADIAMLNQTGAFSDFGTSVIWGDRNAKGQTFTTLALPPGTKGFQLNAVTVQSTGSQGSNSTLALRVGTVSGTSFNQLVNESAQYFTNVSVDDYITLTLSSPTLLQGSTLYGFDVGMTNGSGYVLKSNGPAEYTGGQSYSTGTNNGVGGPTISLINQDRIFHLDMVTVIPEPSTFFLLGMGLLGLIGVRKKRS